MLKCKDVVERADALVDNTPLGWRERFALRMHLLMCHHCRRYVRQLQALVSSLRRPPSETTSQDKIEAVLDKLDKTP